MPKFSFFELFLEYEHKMLQSYSCDLLQDLWIYNLFIQGRVCSEAGLHGKISSSCPPEVGSVAGPERTFSRINQIGGSEGRFMRQQPHGESLRHHRCAHRSLHFAAGASADSHRWQQCSHEVRKEKRFLNMMRAIKI